MDIDGGSEGSGWGDVSGDASAEGEGGTSQTDSTLATSHADTATDAACVQSISHIPVDASHCAAWPHTSRGSVLPSDTQQPSHEHPSI